MVSGSEPSTEASFREHCRQWLASELPSPPDFPLPRGPLEIATREQLDYLCAWQDAAYQAGLVGVDYPVGCGGRGASGLQRVANEEMARAGAPILPNIVGLGMAAPAILSHGTSDQKRELIPGILDASAVWCQGFSEPGAGSDLANVRTTAVREGDHWLVSGTKIWTSLAGFATWILLLARTDPDDKYGGLTYFCAPLPHGERVERRPLIKMTGERGFFEVHLDQLVVEDRWRVGAVGEGWRVAMTTLLHERGGGGLVTPRSGGGEADVGSRAEDLVELARQRPRGQDPVLRDRLVQLLVRQRAFDAAHRRAGVEALVDHPLRIPLQHKLVESELRQDIAALGRDLGGLASSRAGDAEGAWTRAYMGSYGYTIAAGTSEIQRNILGERVLGLEKSK